MAKQTERANVDGGVSGNVADSSVDVQPAPPWFSRDWFWGLALMLAGYTLNPPAVPQFAILFLSMLAPFFVGLLVNRFRQDEMAPLVWLIGLIWMLIVSLWVLDMPTGPAHCFQCDATEKLTRTFFCLPMASGLIDNDGPFIGTWPAAALVGYAIGAKLALRKR